MELFNSFFPYEIVPPALKSQVGHMLWLGDSVSSPSGPPLGGGTWWISERCSFHLLTGEIAWGRWRVPDKRDPPPCLTLINIQLCPLNPSTVVLRQGGPFIHPLIYLFILNHGGWCGGRRRWAAGDYDVVEAVQMDRDAFYWSLMYTTICFFWRMRKQIRWSFRFMTGCGGGSRTTNGTAWRPYRRNSFFRK